jgi:hypothetical protein
MLLLKLILKGVLFKKKLKVKAEEKDFNVNKVLDLQFKNSKFYYLVR